MVAVTHTRTHVHRSFANPYLTCDTCGARVTGWHNQDFCGCSTGWWNRPCGCMSGGVTSVCPSWGPVDECRCQRHLGHVPHAEPRPAPDPDHENTTERNTA